MVYPFSNEFSLMILSHTLPKICVGKLHIESYTIDEGMKYKT